MLLCSKFLAREVPDFLRAKENMFVKFRPTLCIRGSFHRLNILREKYETSSETKTCFPAGVPRVFLGMSSNSRRCTTLWSVLDSLILTSQDWETRNENLESRLTLQTLFTRLKANAWPNKHFPCNNKMPCFFLKKEKKTREGRSNDFYPDV